MLWPGNNIHPLFTTLWPDLVTNSSYCSIREPGSAILPCCKEAESWKYLVNSTDDYHMTLFVYQACKVGHTCYNKLNCILLKQDFFIDFV